MTVDRVVGVLDRFRPFRRWPQMTGQVALMGVLVCISTPARSEPTGKPAPASARSSAPLPSAKSGSVSPATQPNETSATPPPAMGSAPPGTEQARLVYEQAVQAYGEHRYKDAVLLFQQADALRPNPAFSFNIGIAYEDMGDAAMALSHYRSYLRQLPKAPDRDEVDVRIRRLERVLADKGLQQVTVTSNPAGAVVTLDGKARGVTPWTGEVPPGAHAVSLAMPGYAEETRDFDLPPARAIDVPVTLRRPSPTPRESETAKVNDAISEESDAALWQHVRPLTWGVLGVGAAALGGALGFELARVDFEERSQASLDPLERGRLHQSAQRREVWAKGLLMTGIGLSATAILLAYRDIDDALTRRRVGVSLGWTPKDGPQLNISTSF